VKVGVACSEGCVLGAHEIEVIDGEGAALARARLSDTPWAGTNALYWTDVELKAPGSEGRHVWQIRSSHDVASGFSRKDHSSSATFSFTTAGQPEHSVTIAAMDALAGTPVDGVELRLGAYRGTTDDKGVATIAVPSGSYEVVVWKVGYEASPVAVAVTADITVRIEMQLVRKAEQPYWM